MGQSLLPPDVDKFQVPIFHGVFFGDYPEALVKRGKHSDIWFNPDGQSNTNFMCSCPNSNQCACTGTFKANYPRQSFDTVIRQRNAPDAEMFADFLSHTFTLDPDQRAKVSDLLAHPWLNP